VETVAQESKSAKQNAQKRMKIEKARVLKMETCAIENSDKSDSEFDFGNYAAPPASSDGPWQLPIKDNWQPQDKANAKFRVRTPKPELSHRLTQNEIFAKYPLTAKPLPFGRIKILRNAAFYQRNALLKNADSQDKFTRQDFVNFSCVSDQNRPIAVIPNSYAPMTQTLEVHVSSYVIPKNSSLAFLVENRPLRRKLVRAVRSVTVDLDWLRSVCRPELSKVLEEMVLGTSVMRVGGEDVASGDALSLSFTGRPARVKGFSSLPQGHRKVVFQVEQPEAPNPDEPLKREIWYDSQHRVTKRMCQLMKALHTKFHLRMAPPPPFDTTQIVKLRWTPSQNPALNGADDGIWHGLFATHFGANETKTTMQQCSLTTDWVESAFSLAFRRECKEIATKAGSKRNAGKHLFIPSGASRNLGDDDPPSEELLTGVRVQYLQGELDSCLRDSMASAIHGMGFTEEAQELAREESMSGRTVVLFERAVQVVRKLFKKTNLVLRKVPHASLMDHVTREDTNWPMVLVLRTSDGICSSHAVTTWNHMIYDSNCAHALRWSQKSLDWCSGQDTSCIGFSKVYQLCPENFGCLLEGSNIRIGTQVESKLAVSRGLGWVRRLPPKGRDGQQQKGCIVCYMDGSTAKWSFSDIMKYELKK
jgi:hypothetical protein